MRENIRKSKRSQVRPPTWAPFKKRASVLRNYRGLVEQVGRQNVGLDSGNDWLDPVLRRLLVEDDEPELGGAASLVQEQGAAEVGGHPLLVDAFVEGSLKKRKKAQLTS